MIKEELFSKIGIGTDWIVAGLAGMVVILLVMQIVSMVKMGKMKKQYKQFMSGSDGATMEEVITKRFSEIDELKENDKQQSEGIQYLKEKFKFTYQKMGMVKYDAYREMGGQLSFALTMLDQDNNGFLMNSVHNRDGNYCYVKEIANGVADVNLSEEEEKSLFMAIHKEV